MATFAGCARLLKRVDLLIFGLPEASWEWLLQRDRVPNLVVTSALVLSSFPWGVAYLIDGVCMTGLLWLLRFACGAGLIATTVCFAGKLRPWAVEVLLTCSFLGIALMSVWLPYERSDLFFRSAFTGINIGMWKAMGFLGPRTFVASLLSVLLQIVHEVAAIRYMNHELGNNLFPRFWLLYVTITLVHLVMLFRDQLSSRQLYAAEVSLQAEKSALESLLRMACDTLVILEADGRTVRRTSWELDTLMGEDMLGKEVTGLFAHGWEAILEMLRTDGGMGERVMLRHVTIRTPNLMTVRARAYVVLQEEALHSLARGAGLAPGRTSVLLGIQFEEPVDLSVASAATPGGADAASSSHAPDAMEALDCAVVRYGSNASSVSCAKPPSMTLESATAMLPALAPITLSSVQLMLVMQEVVRDALTRETIETVIELACTKARGGALVVIAPMVSYLDLFNNDLESGRSKAMFKTSDGGYMTQRLHRVHVGTDSFEQAFRDFTEHTATDRWPSDYHDERARGQPKDGAFLLDSWGFCRRCAVKLLGLHTPRGWDGVGTKHEAGLAAAWSLDGSIVVVSSDSGSVHCIWRQGDDISAIRVQWTPHKLSL